jgi:hypothetical protein
MTVEMMAQSSSIEKRAKLQLTRLNQECEAIWIVNQTISPSHQVDIKGMDHAARVWARLRPTLTHADGDRIMGNIMSITMSQFTSPMLMISEFQRLQNQMLSVPGGEEIWNESQTVRLAVRQFTGEQWVSFRETLYSEQAIKGGKLTLKGWRLSERYVMEGPNKVKTETTSSSSSMSDEHNSGDLNENSGAQQTQVEIETIYEDEKEEEEECSDVMSVLSVRTLADLKRRLIRRLQVQGRTAPTRAKESIAFSANSQQNSNEEAMNANTKTHRNGGKRDESKIVCYECSEMGHRIINCPIYIKRKEKQTNNSNNNSSDNTTHTVMKNKGRGKRQQAHYCFMTMHIPSAKEKQASKQASKQAR